MATPGHGVRMQYNFTNDLAGPVGAVSPSSPRWLRLTRTGSTLTSHASTDGAHWTEIGTVSLAGLPHAMFMTTEYRRGMIRTTFTASPRRGRVLAAKVIVIGSVTFIAGLVGAAIAFTVGQKIIQSHGWKAPTWQVWPLTSGIGVHVVVGTAAMLAVAAILALTLGTVLRRAAGAVTSVIALLIFPVILAIVLPQSPANWVMRIFPAAAFSLQQATPRYGQVTNSCLPYNGCYPLAPWAGFAVLCAWALVALAGALFLLRRRDA